MLINDLYNNKTPAVAENALNEFAPSDGGGDSGNYFQALASAWYNGTFDSGSLEKGIKSQQDVERLLQRGIVCPDGVTRKFDIGYNSDFDGVVISSDDYYEHSDYDDKGQEVDSRTGQKWGPYDYMEFGGEELDESAQWRDPKYKDQLYTQEKPDYNDTREYDRAMWNPKPKDYPGRKELPAGGEYSNNDPLTKGFGRSGIKNSILDRGKRKGLPSRDQITSLKGSIQDAHGRHTRANLPEGMEGQVVFSGTGADGGTYEIIQSSPTDFMIHANGKHIDTYGSLQRAMSVLKNEVVGLQQGMAEGQLEFNTPDPVVVVQDLKGNILDKINLSVAAQKYKLGAAQNIKNQLAHQNYTTIGNYVIVSPMSGQPQDATTQGVAEGQTDYQKRRQRERDVDAGKPVKPEPRNPQNDYFARRKKEKDLAEVSLGDYRKKATVNKAVAQTNKFFDRDDPAKVAAADQTIAKRERGLARADARIKPYIPPAQDAEKQQRDLTTKYPNIDQLVADAERNRDPYYDRAEGNAYYRGREAEQNYQKLKQIQRVIQGLNESLQRTQP